MTQTRPPQQDKAKSHCGVMVPVGVTSYKVSKMHLSYDALHDVFHVCLVQSYSIILAPGSMMNQNDQVMDGH